MEMILLNTKSREFPPKRIHPFSQKMKTTIRRFSLLTVFTFIAVGLHAQTFKTTDNRFKCTVISGTNNVSLTGNLDYTGGYTGSYGNLVIPSTVDYNGTTYTVTEVGYHAFRYRTDLTSLTIPGSVTYIYNPITLGCTNLAAIYMEPTTPPTRESSSSTLGVFYASGYPPNTNLVVYVPEDVSGTDAIKTNYKAWDRKYVPAWRYYHKNCIITNVKINTTTEGGCGSLYVNFAFEVPTGLTAYYATGTTAGRILLSPVPANANGKYVVPTGTPVFLRGTPATYTILETGETPATLSPARDEDALLGTLTDMTVTAKQYKTLGVGKTSKTVGMYPYTGTTLAAHKIYAPNNTAAGSSSIMEFDFNEEITTNISNPLIHSATPFYDLSGKRITNPAKGTIYIQNGKKYIE